MMENYPFFVIHYESDDVILYKAKSVEHLK